MSKLILQSIKPQYCELIVKGKKTIEVRKTRPKLDVPFKVYIYETKFINRCKDCEYCSFESIVMSRMKDVCKYEENNWKITSLSSRCFQNKYSGGKVIGEYVCDRIDTLLASDTIGKWKEVAKASCLTFSELDEYSGINEKTLFLWHISDLKIYDKPKELSEFHKPCINPGMRICELCEFADFENTDVLFPRCINVLIHPPQSWCYVEEV